MSSSLPENVRLAEIARQLTATRWACSLCDADWRLVWVSDELKVLLGEDDEAEIGYGKHMSLCYMSETWRKTITHESQLESFRHQGPVFMADTGPEQMLEVWMKVVHELGMEPAEAEDFAALAMEMQPADPPGDVIAFSFDYLQGDLPPFKVAVCVLRLRDETGALIGHVTFYSSALPARVLAFVARGDEEMFTRMAGLVDPGRRQAAILFADLQASAVLSRRLPSGTYFKLIRSLTTAMDEVVIGHQGIVGKHAGDGVSAFFLAQDFGSSSGASRAAIEAARAIAEAAGTAAKEVAEETGLFEASACLVNVGVHWGGTLYMGQLVTGGRLEVTALGDEVNECARIQESARDGQALATKSLIEHLADADALALNLDPDGVVYRTIGELPEVSPKAIRDAGGIPVTEL